MTGFELGEGCEIYRGSKSSGLRDFAELRRARIGPDNCWLACEINVTGVFNEPYSTADGNRYE